MFKIPKRVPPFQLKVQIYELASSDLINPVHFNKVVDSFVQNLVVETLPSWLHNELFECLSVFKVSV